MERFKKKILFVNGVTDELGLLYREFAGRNNEHYWEAHLADSGLDAMDYLADAEVNAVVADLRLEDMSGVQVLDQVAKQQIRAQRIVLADPGDLQSLLRCVGGVHQFLIKPCVSERLELVLDRTKKLDVWLPSLRVHELVGRLPKMPSPPGFYHELVNELQAAEPSRERIGRLLGSDPVLTAKLLQLVNSAAYGDPIDEADPTAALEGQGLDTIKGMLLLSHQFSHFNATQGSGFAPGALWKHSQLVGQLAGWIAECENADPRIVRHAGTAGLLHDIGKVALAANLPRQFNEAQFHARANNLAFWESEQDIFGATHAEIGGWMLGTWGLPLPVVEAVTLHHHPARLLTGGFSPLTAVHVANAFDHATGVEQAHKLVDQEYLHGLRLLPRITVWWEHCQRLIKERAAQEQVNV